MADGEAAAASAKLYALRQREPQGRDRKPHRHQQQDALTAFVEQGTWAGLGWLDFWLRALILITQVSRSLIQGLNPKHVRSFRTSWRPEPSVRGRMYAEDLVRVRDVTRLR